MKGTVDRSRIDKQRINKINIAVNINSRNRRRLLKKFPNDVVIQDLLTKELEKYMTQ